MHIKAFLQKASNLFAENRLLKFVVIVQMLALIWVVGRVEDIKNKIRTVIQPPVLNSKVEVSGSWTSDSYVKEYIRYIGALVWNYSPGTARTQFAELLVSWHPSSFEAAKEKLYLKADQIEQTRAASVFYINRIENHSDKHVIEVIGNKLLTMQDKSVENTTMTYMVQYAVENGRFWIMGIEEKDPRKIAVAPMAGSPQQNTNQNKRGIGNVKPE